MSAPIVIQPVTRRTGLSGANIAIETTHHYSRPGLSGAVIAIQPSGSRALYGLGTAEDGLPTNADGTPMSQADVDAAGLDGGLREVEAPRLGDFSTIGLRLDPSQKFSALVRSVPIVKAPWLVQNKETLKVGGGALAAAGLLAFATGSKKLGGGLAAAGAAVLVAGFVVK